MLALACGPAEFARCGDTSSEGVLPVVLLMKKLCRPLGYCSWRLTLQVAPRVDGRGRAVQHASVSPCSSISLSPLPVACASPSENLKLKLSNLKIYFRGKGVGV